MRPRASRALKQGQTWAGGRISFMLILSTSAPTIGARPGPEDTTTATRFRAPGRPRVPREALQRRLVGAAQSQRGRRGTLPAAWPALRPRLARTCGRSSPRAAVKLLDSLLALKEQFAIMLIQQLGSGWLVRHEKSPLLGVAGDKIEAQHRPATGTEQIGRR